MLVTESIEDWKYSVEIVAFREILIAWGRKHFRPFPWRFTESPYHILIAEVLLHRTQAIQVAPVYRQFIEHYPDIPALARATREELHERLFSLGLRWRIDLILDMASALMSQFGGEMPRERSHLISLPGISDYIASAVRCFAWDLPEAIIDTNTVRIAGRLFGLEIKDSSRRNRRFREIIQAMVDTVRPREYSFALLDLANQACGKKKPFCVECPVFEYCKHAASGVANQAEEIRKCEQGNI
ncbi:MAG: DNA-binding protein [Pseudomonadota bacterium]